MVRWVPAKESDLAELCRKWITVFGAEDSHNKYRWNFEWYNPVEKTIEAFLDARAAPGVHIADKTPTRHGEAGPWSMVVDDEKIL